MEIVVLSQLLPEGNQTWLWAAMGARSCWVCGSGTGKKDEGGMRITLQNV